MLAAHDIPIAPPVDELLDVDREFRRHAARAATAVLHTTRTGRRYSALYSASALAQRAGRLDDWVIIDLELPGPNVRWTVVTEWRGVMKGRRVVRGREAECLEYYRGRAPHRLRPSWSAFNGA
jgi:hypothetical protein